jgi:hypothetical protein
VIAVWVAAGGVLAALLLYAGRLAAVRSPAAWPGEAPLNPHDNRSRDPHLGHLPRVLSTDAVDAAHRELVGITDQLVGSPSVYLRLGSAEAAWRRLGPEVADFLADPPRDPVRYRQRLAELLPRIEAL